MRAHPKENVVAINML